MDHGVESVVIIGGVIHGTHGTIRLDQTVLSLDHISVTLLGLRLDVSGVGILDAVVERVLGVGDRFSDNGLVNGGGVVGVGGSGMDEGSAIVAVFDG